MSTRCLPTFRSLRLRVGFAFCLLAAGVGLACVARGATLAPGELDLSEDKTRTLVARLERGQLNHLGLAATVEGVTGTIMVDTGAPATLLNEGKYGFLLPGPNRKLPVGLPATTRINAMVSPMAFAHDFHLGSNNLGGSPVAVIPQHYLYQNPGPGGQGFAGDYDGIMGENFLRRYRAVLDCGRQLLYLNLGEAKPQTLAALLPARGWTRVPMSNVVRSFSVPCALNGHRFRLIVDTGAPYTVLDQTLLAAAQVKCVDSPLKGALLGNPEDTLGLADLDSLQIGDFTATNVQMASSRSLGRAFAYVHDKVASGPVLGLLGSDMLAFNGAIIDVGGHALYLKHLSPGARKW